MYYGIVRHFNFYNYRLKTINYQFSGKLSYKQFSHENLPFMKNFNFKLCSVQYKLFSSTYYYF